MKRFIGLGLGLLIVALWVLALPAVASAAPPSKDCNDQPSASLSVRMMKQRTACRAWRDGRQIAAEGGMELTNWGATPNSCHLIAGPPQPGERGRGFCVGYVTLFEEANGDLPDTDWHCSVPMIHALKEAIGYGTVIHTYAGAAWRCSNDEGTDSFSWPSSDKWKPHFLARHLAGLRLARSLAGPPNPDPHGPYWPCNRSGTTCLLPVPDRCEGIDAAGRTVCPLPPGSAPHGHRHRPPRFLAGRGPLTRADNRRIDQLVVRWCGRGRRVVLTDGPVISNGDGAWQWSRDVSWVGRPGSTSVYGLITSGYAPILTSAPGCRKRSVDDGL